MLRVCNMTFGHVASALDFGEYAEADAWAKGQSKLTRWRYAVICARCETVVRANDGAHVCINHEEE